MRDHVVNTSWFQSWLDLPLAAFRATGWNAGMFRFVQTESTFRTYLSSRQGAQTAHNVPQDCGCTSSLESDHEAAQCSLYVLTFHVNSLSKQ